MGDFTMVLLAQNDGAGCARTSVILDRHTGHRHSVAQRLGAPSSQSTVMNV
jgi:hypothetical protein